jgi:hypothetical protein
MGRHGLVHGGQGYQWPQQYFRSGGNIVRGPY